MKNESILYWLWLSERCGSASRDFGKLIRQYDNPFDLYRLEEEEIEQLEGISQRMKIRLCDKNLDFAYRTKYTCAKMGAEVIPYGDPRYPERLRHLEDPPVLLYVLGELPDMNDRLCIGMVGTRKMSEYGRTSAYKISYELASAYGVVVSGMASGVDGVCAVGALAAKGSTVAVLGSGLSVVYPKEHKKLMAAIAKHGAVVTEYAPSEPPFGANFPKRNRIISGLCQGVLVIEGAKGSGALITATKAIEQGRDLFALPGQIDEKNAKGPNELIQSGASSVLSSEDILKHYDFLYHDRINYRAWNQAKLSPYPEDQALKEFGVALEYIQGTWREKDRPKLRKRQEKTPEVSAPDLRKEETETSAPTPTQDEAALSDLDPISRKVLEAMPVDRPISLDSLSVDGVSSGDVITSMTILEVSGFCVSLPGGMFARK